MLVLHRGQTGVFGEPEDKHPRPKGGKETIVLQFQGHPKNTWQFYSTPTENIKCQGLQMWLKLCPSIPPPHNSPLNDSGGVTWAV